MKSHSQGVIYNQLRPYNILVDDHAKITLRKQKADLNPSETLKRQRKGAYQDYNQIFVAPEIRHEVGVPSQVSDIWSLGSVMYLMSTGLPLNINERPDGLPLVPEFSSHFNDLLRRILEEDPVKRIQWVYLRKHIFWRESIPGLKLAKDFEFENYLKFKRGINPEDFFELSKGGSFLVNLIRFSYPEYEERDTKKGDKIVMLRLAKGYNEISVPFTEEQKDVMQTISAAKMKE